MNLEDQRRERKYTDLEKDQSQSDDENFLSPSNSPPRRSKLTTFNSSDGSENPNCTGIHSSFQDDTNHHEIYKRNHYWIRRKHYFFRKPKRIGECQPLGVLHRSYEADGCYESSPGIFEKRKPTDYESWDREVFSKFWNQSLYKLLDNWQESRQWLISLEFWNSHSMFPKGPLTANDIIRK